MALDAVRVELSDKLDTMSLHVRDFAASRSPLSPRQFSLLDECLLEGLVSRIWQAWSNFCRSCIIESCIGTTSARGQSIIGLSQAATEEHVSGAAIRANQNRDPATYWSAPNAVLRIEPTWGDGDILVKILTRLRPSNVNQLLAALSSCYESSKAVQRIRNAAAHNHVQNFQEILGMRSRYIAFPITHPTHAMFWIEPVSQDFLITHAIDELKDVGLAAAN